MIPEFIVISKAEYFPGEAGRIRRMFEAGLPLLHLRKPGTGIKELAGLLRQLPSEYYNRIVVHHHYELAARLNLRGIHLPEKVRLACEEEPEGIPADYRTAGFSVSTSFHCIPEPEHHGRYTFDYAFLSPVFDSISKKGYRGKGYDLSAVKRSFPVYALGGLTPGHIPLIKSKGFDGPAFLGYIWESPSPHTKVSALVQTLRNLPDTLQKNTL
ncbi:thiamine phosphate synthase [Sinomicrobium soli]|uniref:thiamine phosphate synthase n=1 Tax=Sinomicrobium sp. N-1-3-6 TaxID=2219864 RepID=UPI000DCB1F29|nr:thiamine phosphate synthase [Sinomicrobium sp. N-1-3-6]RAV27440.1 thiamine phosphate synthase [Sinomicrobium sp. N-1-3-6]